MRDRLAAELRDIGSADEAANWAHQVLGAKSSLIAADARQIEEAFQARLAKLGSPADSNRGTVITGESALQSSLSSAERRPVEPTGTTVTDGIDKSQLTNPEPRRIRDRDHVRFVAKQPCLICGRRPADPHHLRFAQHRALGRKVSDEFTVPLCRGHHREVHRCGDEAAWWKRTGIDPTVPARALWLETHPLPTASDKTGLEGATSRTAVGTDPRTGKRDRPIGKRGPKYKTKPITVAGPQ